MPLESFGAIGLTCRNIGLPTSPRTPKPGATENGGMSLGPAQSWMPNLWATAVLLSSEVAWNYVAKPEAELAWALDRNV